MVNRQLQELGLRIREAAKFHRMAHDGKTYSSRIQLPTDTPPQLMPPTKLPARDSRRCFSRFDPDTEIGFVPFPQCAEAVPTESFRGGGALNMLSPTPLAWDRLPVRSPLPALCKAEVRFDACCPGGETELWRVAMSIGAAAPVIVMGGEIDILLRRGRESREGRESRSKQDAGCENRRLVKESAVSR